jgi:pimeloyl-ACP methyl ester carboxylesterase
VSDRLRFDRDGTDWPLRESSRFVEASGLSWHVQRMGEGPTCLLLHGAGGSSHSWRDVAPHLARHLDVIALDLPGHGFTEPLPSRRLSLPGMAQSVGDLLDSLQAVPSVVVGHSAGAAVAARLCLDGRAKPRVVVSFNGALRAFRGLAQQFCDRQRLRRPGGGDPPGRAGYRVTVLEKLDAPGGRAYVFRQDGFTFDAGPTIITAPFLLEELWTLCGRRMADDVELRPVDAVLPHPLRRRRGVRLQRRPRAMRAEVARFARRRGGLRTLHGASAAIYKVGFEQLGHVAFDSWTDMLRDRARPAAS